jgi:ubiquinone/menaquinone biosynthesis C-methylase UbiE
LGSIPDPQRALEEAERVLAPGGFIVVFEKMVDDGNTPSLGRQCAGCFAQCTFADINRNLSQMMGSKEDSPLKITQYHSMSGRLDGCIAGSVDSLYRVAMLVRKTDYPDRHTTGANLIY